ncbi:TRAP transporter small permease subunit [Sneathiella sp. P13V-1]|uniref:TRAP transporter small permease subunit n=1 Tax=Sneathiella sp. P13V-1 TaxID=2697366 RepID=UPI00187BAD41|nr:TRAP transporter small permease subunit [Sneathiella sp. P13V-1]MBE7636894.1 TRAP transporter small permease subunit [Sneathiella sp. P13V-1]
MEALGTFLLNFLMGFVNLALLPWHIYNWVMLDTLKKKMNALTMAGMSIEFFFMVVALVLIVIGIGILRRSFLRKAVYGLETFNGRIGRFAAWFALLMTLQQVAIIAVGQIFRGNEILISPLGISFMTEELQWLSGQLKFYNTILIALASAYTFIEGGHVRVDLVYASCKKRTKHWIDLLGTLFFFIPSTVMLWWFAWPITMNAMFAQKPLNIWSTSARWRDFRFETSGTAEFSWVWTFKFMVLVFAAFMFICAIGFLLRNILALLQKDEDIPTHYSFDDEQAGDMGTEAPAHPL